MSDVPPQTPKPVEAPQAPTDAMSSVNTQAPPPAAVTTPPAATQPPAATPPTSSPVSKSDVSAPSDAEKKEVSKDGAGAAAAGGDKKDQQGFVDKTKHAFERMKLKFEIHHLCSKIRHEKKLFGVAIWSAAHGDDAKAREEVLERFRALVDMYQAEIDLKRKRLLEIGTFHDVYETDNEQAPVEGAPHKDAKEYKSSAFHGALDSMFASTEVMGLRQQIHDKQRHIERERKRFGLEAFSSFEKGDEAKWQAIIAERDAAIKKIEEEISDLRTAILAIQAKHQ